ncbi:MAG: TlyA family RNA methyltransferase [Hyphomicrobiales bacterium]|nr:TlyA family RNA methyltransferase [Hyphomicrobiales bacterium]
MPERRKIRLDLLLARRGLARSRSHAQDLVRRGAVLIEGAPATKAGVEVCEAAAVTVAVEPYVSRGALKLIAALDAFGFSPAGRDCLDVGASTGGFTQVLLERGAARVLAVDVGRGQLAQSLRDDPRVAVHEGVDARAFAPPNPVGAIVVDVSFISALKVLPGALAHARAGAWLVVLVKPQFEAGREAIGKNGVVRDPCARAAAVKRVADCIAAQSGWRMRASIPSPIAGQDGNEEVLVGATRDDG